MKKTEMDLAFERLAREFLAKHAEIPHEWREIKQWHGDRLDLICGVNTPSEVFVSLNGGQITVGVTGSEDSDFEDWGRPMTESDIALEAFDYFVEVLRREGYVDTAA